MANPWGFCWIEPGHALLTRDRMQPCDLVELTADEESFLEALVADANRGAESAAYDKAITAAGDAAVEQAYKLTPAALAHGLVRDAIGVLVGSPRGPYLAPNVADAVQALGDALAALNRALIIEEHDRGREVPPQPIEQAIEEAHEGLTAEPAGE